MSDSAPSLPNASGHNTASASASAASQKNGRLLRGSTFNSGNGGRRNNINLLVCLGVVAMAFQLWSFRGSFFLLDQTRYSDCKDIYELLQDAPLQSRLRNGITEPALPPPPSLSNEAFPWPRTDTNHSLVVMVLSRRNAFAVRQGIRDTWAHQADNVYFVLGQGCTIPPNYRGVDEGGNSFCKVKPRPLDNAHYLNATVHQMAHEHELTRKLLQEQSKHQDILIMPHTVDMYRTLPAKLKFAYTFVNSHLPQVKWVLKVDDDFYVQIRGMETYLQTLDATQPTLVGGDIRYNHAAHMGGKWKELPQFPRGATYPPFPLGSYGHVVTRSIVEFVSRYQDGLFDYQGEDVSIGIWLNHSMVPFQTRFVQTDHMANHGDCRKPSLFVVGHDISPFKMKVCLRAVESAAGGGTTAKTLPRGFGGKL